MPASDGDTVLAGADRLVISRLVAARPGQVFEAWSRPEHLRRWYAPRGCSIDIHEFDFRPGGRYRTTIYTPGMRDCTCGGVFTEIVVGERIAQTIHFCDAAGSLVEPAEVGMPAGWPREMAIDIRFSAEGDGTRVMLRQTVPEALARETGAHAGWVAMFERLDHLLGVGL